MLHKGIPESNGVQALSSGSGIKNELICSIAVSEYVCYMPGGSEIRTHPKNVRVMRRTEISEWQQTKELINNNKIKSGL